MFGTVYMYAVTFLSRAPMIISMHTSAVPWVSFTINNLLAKPIVTSVSEDTQIK